MCVQVIVTYMSGTIYKDCRRRDPRFISFTLSVHTGNGSGLGRLWDNSVT